MLGASPTNSEEPRNVEQKPNTVHKAGIVQNLHPEALRLKLPSPQTYSEGTLHLALILVAPSSSIAYFGSTTGPPVTFVRCSCDFSEGP